MLSVQASRVQPCGKRGISPSARDLRPHDHVAYAGRGSVDFSRLAMHLVASAAPDERVVVCADPEWDGAAALDVEIEAGRVLLLLDRRHL